MTGKEEKRKRTRGTSPTAAPGDRVNALCTKLCLAGMSLTRILAYLIFESCFFKLLQCA